MIISFIGRGFILIICLILIAGQTALFAAENDLDSVLSEVANHLARRDYPSALALFDQLKPEDAEKTDILIMRSGILNSAGRPAQARAIATRIVAKEPDNTDALMILADAAALEGKDRERRNTLERVIKADPGHTRALNDLGNINLGSRNLRLAASYFDRALTADPVNGEALVGRAMVYRYAQDLRRSEQMFNRAVNQYPQWARPLHERSRLYKGAGFLNDALRDLDAAKELEPDNYWITVDRGLVLMEMARRPEALEEFNRAIGISPKDFLAYVYSAGIKEQEGDYAGAERDYTILARLKPEYYFAFESLGMIRMKNKRWAEARDAFLEAYKQAPKEYSYVLLAAVNWMRAGRLTDPKQFLAQVLKTVPRDSLEYSMIRLFHDLSGEADVAVKVEMEQNIYTKARMLFYMASYYDVRGNANLANRYYLLVQELDAVATIEWRLNEWILTERNIGLRVEK
jgi:tetratricopeptide (TPR) repeat protein